MRNKIFITIIFIVAILLRLYPIITKPLWLDEIYSLYFASNFSALQILFRLPDCHPGLFYLILKGLMSISLNPIFLRLFVSAIPELIGCIIIQKVFKKPILTAIFLLNPFFIHSAYQIRMYGLVSLLSIIIFSQVYLKKISVPKILILIFIANLISYSFIIPSICLLFYLAITKQKKWLFIIPLILIEFFIFKGPQYKTFAESSSWIAAPTLNNIPSVISSSLALNTDINSRNLYPFFWSIIFYLIFSIFVFYQSKKHLLFLFTFTLPLLFTILISIIFPFLSQHNFFYMFIPKISLFLPRFLIPTSIAFYIFLYKFYPSPFLILILLPFWIKTYSSINLHSFYPSQSPLSAQNQLILPPWENFRLNQNFSKTDLEKMSQNYHHALSMEKSILNFDNDPNCQLIQSNFPITYVNQTLKSLESYQQHFQKTIKYCTYRN